MSQQTLGELVQRLAEPLVRAAGLEIWGVEIERSGRTLVRVYIDSPQHSFDAGAEAESDVLSATLDQCEDISRQLSLALDVENEGETLFPSSWVLEVSSPGMSRTFFRLEQMRAYLGCVVVARLRTPLTASSEGRKLWTGELTAVDDTSFTLRPVTITDEDEILYEGNEGLRIPWSQVRTAHVRALFPKPPKPGKASSRAKSCVEETR